MSVGVQRLREERDRIRQGAIDKREDPSIVDRALEADANRRQLQAESDRLKAERNVASKRVGEAIRGGARPEGPEVAELRDASTRAGARIDEIDAELAAVEAELEDLLLRIPNPADPEVPVGGEEANVTVRTWGDPVEHEVTTSGTGTWVRRPHWEIGDALDIIDNVRGAKITGSGLPGLQGCRLPLAAEPDQLVPGRSHHGARLHGGLAAGGGQRRVGARHGPDPRQGRPDVRRHA